MVWRGISGSMASPTVPIMFSPPMPHRKPLGESTNVNKPPSDPRNAKRLRIPAVASPPSHDALWDAWDTTDAPATPETFDAPLTPETAAEIEKFTEESWALWDTEEAPAETDAPFSLETAEPARALVRGAALLVVYIIIVALTMGWTLMPEHTPLAPSPAKARAARACAGACLRVQELLDEWTF